MEVNLKNKKSLLAMIGLAKKAGAVIPGTEQVILNVRKNIPLIVLLSSDASLNTKKKIADCCGSHKTEMFEVNIDTMEMAHMIGNKNLISAVGITDRGFTEAINNILKSE